MIMNFLSKLRYRMQGWMVGRNGSDTLSRDMNILALVLMLSGSLFHVSALYWVGFGLFVLTMFRIFSRNRVRRSAENTAYYGWRGRAKTWFYMQKQHLASKRYYRFYKCSSCKQKLRVPKGKGKIAITCPKCGVSFIKKT